MPCYDAYRQVVALINMMTCFGGIANSDHVAGDWGTQPFSQAVTVKKCDKQEHF